MPRHFNSFAAPTFLLFLLLNWIAVGCSPAQPNNREPTTTTTPTSEPTRLPSPTPTSTTTPVVPDSGWILLRPGMDRRTINVYDDQHQVVESVFIMRLDQHLFQLDIGYHETPQTLEDWQRETGALIVTNGGYFRIENDRYIPTGLTIVNGMLIGSSYEGFGGMLAVYRDHADVRALASMPYHAGEPIIAGLQSFPLLVKPGGLLGFSAENEDNLQARRTVIAQDMDGNILLMVAPMGFFTLHQLSVFLSDSDLNLDIALNLDGGPSSGIFVDQARDVIPAQSPLPIVILVYAR